MRPSSAAGCPYFDPPGAQDARLIAACRQHFLHFLPVPRGQGSFGPDARLRGCAGCRAMEAPCFPPHTCVSAMSARKGAADAGSRRLRHRPPEPCTAPLAKSRSAAYCLYGRIHTGPPMNLEAEPNLEPGRAYRTRELRRWSANPTRLARRLVREGKLHEAAHGLFYAPVESRFGQAPASDSEILRAFLGGERFVITGPPRWNALGLASTAMFAATLAYNTRRTGNFTFDGRRFMLRRVLFPEEPPAEWFVVDLLQHHDMAGTSLTDLEHSLTATLRAGRWRIDRLREMAAKYGTKATQALVARCIASAGATT